MDYKYIEQLLERYWNCETSLEEEAILRMFFSQDDIPAELLRYKDLFGYAQEEKERCTLGDDFDERILEQTEGLKLVKAKTISPARRLMQLFKAAAMVAIVLTLGNASQYIFTSGNNAGTAGTAEVRMQWKGASVAMKDSVKTDTLQKAFQQSAITK